MTDINKYDSLIEKLKECRSDAEQIDYLPWLEAIDDLLFEATRTYQTKILEDQWNAYFKENIAPDYQAVIKENPGLTIVFGYLGPESHLPDTISFEDLGTGFSKTRSFDPESVDMLKLINSFASEAFHIGGNYGRKQNLNSR